MIISPIYLSQFCSDSNLIEGLDRVTEREYEALVEFVGLEGIRVEDLFTYVRAIQPDARLRGYGMDVQVGQHRPPSGGPHILDGLNEILNDLHSGRFTPYEIHCRYETLHPFTDGNGRSGRALWLWHMTEIGQLNQSRRFLHEFYYQALQGSRRRS